MLRPLEAEGVLEPELGVLDVPGRALSLRMSNGGVFITQWRRGRVCVGLPHRPGGAQRGRVWVRKDHIQVPLSLESVVTQGGCPVSPGVASRAVTQG